MNNKGKKPVSNPTSQPRTNVTTTPSIIGADVQIVGNVTTVGELQLDGSIKGDLVCGSLVMGESGNVEGTISAETVSVRGKVSGQVKAKSVHLEKSAIIEGDVYHESLSVEAGARLTGRFAHSSNPQETKPATPSKKAAASEAPSFLDSKNAAE